jgi:hypothetical protein
MRLTGNKFIPGIRIEVKEDEPEVKNYQNGSDQIPGSCTSSENGILSKLSGISISTEEVEVDEIGSRKDSNNGDNDSSYESANETFETYTSRTKIYLKNIWNYYKQPLFNSSSVTLSFQSLY